MRPGAVCNIPALFVLFASFQLISSIPIDNGVGGQPEILCLQDSMRILFNTYKPFNGHVYVKGMFRSSPACHLDLSRTPPVDNKAIFNVPYRQCTVTRERSLSPPGISYSAVVIIQFHHLFLTKVDRAYRLTCFYMEAEKTVTQGLRVSMIPTTEIRETRPMPVCRYEVLANNVNGPLVRFAKVGDKVFHKWTCASDVHGMLVHSCYARDGAGSTYQLIDERGCAVDPIALGDLSYSGDLTMAWAQVHVFKFADQMIVNFQCQITLCVRTENGCEGITPPGDCGLSSVRTVPAVGYSAGQSGPGPRTPHPAPPSGPFNPQPSQGSYPTGFGGSAVLPQQPPPGLQPAIPVQPSNPGGGYAQPTGPGPYQPPEASAGVNSAGVPPLRVFPQQAGGVGGGYPSPSGNLPLSGYPSDTRTPPLSPHGQSNLFPTTPAGYSAGKQRGNGADDGNLPEQIKDGPIGSDLGPSHGGMSGIGEEALEGEYPPGEDTSSVGQTSLPSPALFPLSPNDPVHIPPAPPLPGTLPGAGGNFGPQPMSVLGNFGGAVSFGRGGFVPGLPGSSFGQPSQLGGGFEVGGNFPPISGNLPGDAGSQNPSDQFRGMPMANGVMTNPNSMMGPSDMESRFPQGEGESETESESSSDPFEVPAIPQNVPIGSEASSIPVNAPSVPIGGGTRAARARAMAAARSQGRTVSRYQAHKRTPSQHSRYAQSHTNRQQKRYGAINIPRTYRPPVKGRQKRDIPQPIMPATKSDTLDVTSDDMFVFNLDDVYPQSYTGGPNGRNTSTKGSGDPFGILVPRRALIAEASVCMNQMTLVQIVTGIVLFFSTVITALGLCQRRYYLERMKKGKRKSAAAAK